MELSGMELCGISTALRRVWPMKTTKGSRIVLARLLKKAVAEAEAVGELKYRSTLIEDEMKQVDTFIRESCTLCPRFMSMAAVSVRLMF